MMCQNLTAQGKAARLSLPMNKENYFFDTGAYKPYSETGELETMTREYKWTAPQAFFVSLALTFTLTAAKTEAAEQTYNPQFQNMANGQFPGMPNGQMPGMPNMQMPGMANGQFPGMQNGQMGMPNGYPGMPNSQQKAQPSEQQQQMMKLQKNVQQQQGVLNQESTQLQQDESKALAAQESTQKYIDSNDRWILQNDAQMQNNQSKLNALESNYKDKATLESLLRTPGNQLYILRSLLNREAQMKAQALANVQTAQTSLQERQSIVEQDRYRMNSDRSLMQHDQGDYLVSRNSAMLQQAEQARWQANLHPGQSGRYLSQFNQNPYEVGQHPNGFSNPYWRQPPNQ